MDLSQIIVTSRYLKSGTAKTKSQRKNYTKYIATRESVEVREQSKKYSTENQKKLLNDLLSDFPEAKKYLEFEDYKNNPTAENASELISTIIERNADVIGNRQNFVGYMAMRPGVQKRGSHGLFNEKDEPIILDRVANEIANHPGNVWSHVVSLRREDAIRLGYDNSEAWRDLVKRHISDISKAQRIPLCDLKWYAAFHDTTHHPHIHLLVYSTNPKQGFLTREGVDKIRSVLTNDIFHDDLQSIYQEQTLSRDELKTVSKTEFENIIKKFQQSDFDNPQLENLIRKLHSQLQNVKGKKVYGYLPPEVKETVNNIFSELAKDDNICQLYEKWCGLERLKYKTYTQKEKELPALTDNKVFQPVRNMIIKAVLDMNNPVADIEVNLYEPTEQFADTSDNLPVEQPPQLDESEQSADDNVIISDNDDLTAEDFTWSNGNAVTVDIDGTTKTKYYLKWSDSYKEAQKLIFSKESKIDDYKKAEKILLSESNNVLALYDLGKMYSTEQLGVKDDEKSFGFYNKALQGFLQIEPIAKKVKSYLQYQIGIMFFKGLGTPVDNKKAVQYFEESAELGNQYAKRVLAFEYINGKNLEQNIDKGISLLTECADSGDAFSCYRLGNLYLQGEIVIQNLDKAEKYLLSAEDNEFTQYALGKMYLQKEKYDIMKAISYFEKFADKNMWSSYQLGRLYFLGTDGLEKDKEKAMKFLNLSAEQGNEYAQDFLDNTEKFKNEMLANTIFSLFINLSRCIEDDYHNKFQSGKKMIDSKLRRVIQDKKQALGIKQEHGQTQEY